MHRPVLVKRSLSPSAMPISGVRSAGPRCLRTASGSRHRVGANEGESDLILRNNVDGKETKFSGGSGFGQLQFSHDGKWFGYSYSPYTKKGATPPTGPRPKAKIVLVNLGTGKKTEIEGASSFRFNGEAATHIAYRKVAEAPAVPTAPPGPGGPPQPAGSSSSGSDLVLRDLDTGIDFVLGNIADYDFDKKGNWLVTLIDASGQIGNGVHLRDMKTSAVYPIETDKAAYRSLVWDDDTTAFTVTKATEDTGYEGKWISILGFTDLGPKPVKTVYDPKDDKAFPKDMAISAGRGAAWTDALDGFTFAIAERKKKGSETTAPAPKEAAKKTETKGETKGETRKGKKGFPGAGTTSKADAKPDLVVWHWKDERLQPMQEKQAASDRNVTYNSVYWTKDKKFVRLSDDKMRSVSLAAKQKYAIGRDIKPYEYMSYLNGKLFTDVYLVDVKTGKKTKAVDKLASLFGGGGGANVSTSPLGTHFLYYKDGHYHVYDMATGKSANVTEKVPTSFINTDDDHNFDKPATQSYGWSRDGKSVLLSDGWDIWQVGINGNGNSTATNLTVNGKKDGIRYRGLFQFETEAKPGTDLTRPVYTSLYGEWTKKDGLGRIDPSKPGVNVLLWGDCDYGNSDQGPQRRGVRVHQTDRGRLPGLLPDRRHVQEPQEDDGRQPAAEGLPVDRGHETDRVQGRRWQAVAGGDVAARGLRARQEVPNDRVHLREAVAGRSPLHAAGHRRWRVQPGGLHVERLRGAAARHRLPAERSGHVGQGVHPAGARCGDRDRHRRWRQARHCMATRGAATRRRSW